MLGSSAMPAYELEFYEDSRGDQPGRRWPWLGVAVRSLAR
jgi:hypothetical protein